MFLNYEDWDSYGVSCCPMGDCDWSVAWPKDIDTTFLNNYLLEHVVTHPPIEWVHEVVMLQYEILKLKQKNGEREDVEGL